MPRSPVMDSGSVEAYELTTIRFQLCNRSLSMLIFHIISQQQAGLVIFRVEVLIVFLHLGLWVEMVTGQTIFGVWW